MRWLASAKLIDRIQDPKRLHPKNGWHYRKKDRRDFDRQVSLDKDQLQKHWPTHLGREIKQKQENSSVLQNKVNDKRNKIHFVKNRDKKFLQGPHYQLDTLSVGQTRYKLLIDY